MGESRHLGSVPPTFRSKGLLARLYVEILNVDKRFQIMDNNLLSSTPNPQDSETFDTDNSLWQYVQEMSPDTVAKMSQPDSEEVLKLMEHQVSTLLGSLPPEGFGVMITTSREHLGRLLASTMLNG